MNDPPVELVARVEALFDCTIFWGGVDGGYTGAGRWFAEAKDGPDFLSKLVLMKKVRGLYAMKRLAINS